MAKKAAYYTVKRGDTLWKIASGNKSKISGKTINDKIETLKEINDIADVDLIYVDQRIYFSADGQNKTLDTTKTRPEITGFGLRSSDKDADGRSMVATWSWSKTGTKGYTCRWEEYLYGKWTRKSDDSDIDHYEKSYCYHTYNAESEATKVRFWVRPYKSKNSNGKPTYWSTSEGDWSAVQTYDFSDNPPSVPPVPTVKLDELDDRKLTIVIDNIDYEKLGAKYINFDVYKNNTTKVGDTKKATINTTTKRVSTECTVAYGNIYRVRAQAISAKGKTSGWSDFSSEVVTRPIAPKKVNQPYCKEKTDGSISVYLEWEAVSNATSYTIEYTTDRDNFNSGTKNWDEISTIGPNTQIEIQNLEIGHDYYFRVKAKNGSTLSDPSGIVTISIGQPPAAPTTWSSSNSGFVGESMELNWTHNARDGSPQSFANLRLKINDDEPIEQTVANATTPTSGQETKTTEWTYLNELLGTFVSYGGELHFVMNTEHSRLKNAKIQWQVQTAGVTDRFSNDEIDWSAPRIIHIYEKPELELSVTKDLAGKVPFANVTIPPESEDDEPIVINKALEAFPFYVRGSVIMESNNVQKPVGYHLRIVSNEYYETVDDVGRSKVINPGDAVYSKYFDADGTLVVEMSADNIDLEPLISYGVVCDVDMSTGLSISSTDEFNVYWSDDANYKLDATVIVNEDDYTATITPVCVDAEESYVEGITLSVYRREYDGTFTEIATSIPNGGTAVTDPHPALDYARYRIVAKVTDTGALYFYDLPAHEVGCTSVIIQWDEEWHSFDANGAGSVDTPKWAGSMLVLPYDVKVNDKRIRDVGLVTYAGREYPVSYHGMAVTETSSWSTVIPKDDVEAIYALRRLSLWAGPAYVREPSGMGFWANVVPSFAIEGKLVTIPVTLEVTRVEGGV